MSKPGACVRCKEPVTNQTLLTCCKQPCHVACATQWRKSRGFFSNCFNCSQWRCLEVIEVLNEEWKKTPNLWKKSNVSGTIILCGMVSAMNSREPFRDYGEATEGSGEHSTTRLMAIQQPFFLATPKAKSLQI